VDGEVLYKCYILQSEFVLLSNIFSFFRIWWQ